MDDAPLRGPDLTEELRAWLRARPEPRVVLAAALCYELAALVARDAGSVPQAYAVLDEWLRFMKDQIATLTVGAEYNES